MWRSGNRAVDSDAEQQAKLRAQHQQRSEQSARSARGVRDIAQHEAQQKSQRNDGPGLGPGQRTLGDRIAAADHPGQNQPSAPTAAPTAAARSSTGQWSSRFAAAIVPSSVRL